MKQLFAVAIVLVAVLFGTLPASAAQILPFPFSTTSSSGTIGPFSPQGSATCSITFVSGGGSTVTVGGSADSALYQTNTNFGTLGIITSPAAGSVYGGNVAAYPSGFQLSFTGNTGTLSGTVTCGPSTVAPVFGYNSVGPQEFMFPDGSIPVSVSVAGNTTLVAGVAGKTVYVLGYGMSVNGGSNPTWQLGSGAAASCSAPVQFMGPQDSVGGTSALYGVSGGGIWLFKTVVGGSLCFTAGGTTPVLGGWISYAQLAGP